MTKLFSFMASHGEPAPQPNPSQPEDEDMNKEQFDLLQGTLTGLGEKIESFSAKLEAKPETEPTPAPVIDPAKEDKPGITTEQFSQLQTQLSALTAKIDQFSVEVPGQRPGALGGDDTPTVF
ncbi:hypothetical protein D3C84_1022880 [compost metagenome]